MKLSEYLSQKETTAAAMAKALDVHVSTITRIASGQRTPSGELARRIVAETGGDVGFNDLFSGEGEAA